MTMRWFFEIFPNISSTRKWLKNFGNPKFRRTRQSLAHFARNWVRLSGSKGKPTGPRAVSGISHSNKSTSFRKVRFLHRERQRIRREITVRCDKGEAARRRKRHGGRKKERLRRTEKEREKEPFIPCHWGNRLSISYMRSGEDRGLDPVSFLLSFFFCFRKPFAWDTRSRRRRGKRSEEGGEGGRNWSPVCVRNLDRIRIDRKSVV